MLYGDYATSYRVQGTTQERDPQELKAYSLGIKNRFFENRLQLNAGAFYYDYENYGVNYREEVWLADYDGDFLPPETGGPPGGPPGTLSETTTDEGSRDVTADGRMYGIDLSASLIITSRDMLNLSVSWIESEWYDLYFKWEYTEQLATVYDDDGNPIGVEWVDHPDMDYSGKPMTNTPPWTINLNYTHNFTLWNGGTLKPGVSAKYQTGYRLSWKDDDYPWNYQETHYMLNASMVYNSPGDMWSLSAYMNNITDYAEKRQYMSVAGRGRLSISDPRTYGATLSVKF
jgi:iron complex outermembrane receptor protein